MATDDTFSRDWPHSPSHLFLPGAAYCVTAGTYGKEHFFNTEAKLDHLQSSLFEEAERWHWRLQAWAILANHYHFVAHAPEDAGSLIRLLRALHSKSAIWLNQLDGVRGRKVWYQYWDTCLSFDRSYWARLHYVHTNPEKHGVAANAENYRWCSMAWFSRNADTRLQRIVMSFKTDQLNIEDDF
ncbi:MAG: hypothetical protein GC168_16580 [Candidatus Hydrogenedens sp.]|nr:hypothetical protein [Candidatus Hydrogenedens sp.]